MTRRSLGALTVAGAVVVVTALGVAVSARGDDRAASDSPRSEARAHLADANGMGERGGRHGQMQKLMSNDDFRAEAAKLRDEHQAGMDAWWAKYGDDPDAEAARAALESLRDEHRASMNALLQKYGVDTAPLEQRREAIRQVRDLMANDEFRAEVNALRDSHEKAVDAWWDKYADNPRSDEARAAMEKLRDDARADATDLLMKYDVSLPDEDPGLLGIVLGRGSMMGGRGRMMRDDDEVRRYGRGAGCHGALEARTRQGAPGVRSL